MRLRNLFLAVSIVLACWGCHNIEDAKPTTRETFVHFYEAAHNIYGVSAEAVEGGYIILGNETLANGNQNSILIRTDKTGERIGDDVILSGGYSNALKVTNDGYYIIGDSIKTNLQSSDVADLEIYSARVFKLSTTGVLLKKIVIADRKDSSRITDIHGNALTFNDQGDLILLGTYKDAGQSERAFITSLDLNTFDTLWSKKYDLLGRNYQNSNSVHVSRTGKIIWASDLIIDNQSFSKSYLTIPYVEENSTFLNYDQYGATTDQNIGVSDIQPASSSAFGYGIIGTYSSINNTGGNIFFVRVDQYGNIIKGSERYFDGESLGNTNQGSNSNESFSEDTGNALAAANDGGFILGGSLYTTPNRGYGGKDILLIKIDGQGNILWNKILGGAGDESVSSVRETSNGDLLICGTNNLSGLSSIFLIRTDKNGELKD